MHCNVYLIHLFLLYVPGFLSLTMDLVSEKKLVNIITTIIIIIIYLLHAVL